MRRDTNFYDILSFTRGDAAAALSDMAFYTLIQSPQGENSTALAEFAFSECLEGKYDLNVWSVLSCKSYRRFVYL